MKQLIIILLLLGGLLGAALAGYQYMFEEAPPDLVTVDKVQGSATAQDREGASRSLRPGDVLVENTSVSTDASSTLSLKVGDGETVELQPGSQLAVKSVTRDGVSFELKLGQVEASVKRFRGRSVAFGVKDNTDQVRTQQGSLRISTDGKGVMDVAALSGTVERIQPGKAPVVMPTGTREVLAVNGAPLLSGKIPEKVSLNVTWPEQTTLTTSLLTVSGVSTPGSRVTVAGQRVDVDEKGNFSTSVTLKEGSNRVRVEAIGMGAPATSESPELVVDTRPPRFQTRPDALWKH